MEHSNRVCHLASHYRDHCLGALSLNKSWELIWRKRTRKWNLWKLQRLDNRAGYQGSSPKKWLPIEMPHFGISLCVMAWNCNATENWIYHGIYDYIINGMLLSDKTRYLIYLKCHWSFDVFHYWKTIKIGSCSRAFICYILKKYLFHNGSFHDLPCQQMIENAVRHVLYCDRGRARR